MTALSIVVAVQGGAERLNSVLGAIETQLGPDDEVIVAFDGDETSVPSICATYPWARPLPGASKALIPELWRDGIDAARGDRVALSVVHCRPGADWVKTLRSADLEGFAGIGGALVNAVGSDTLGWAVFLLRYTRYTPDAPARETADLPGDNAVYDRAALVAHREAYREGFWEPEVHALLLGEGRRLLFDPALVSVHANGYGAAGFARQRFLHGVRFGRDRAASMHVLRRALQAIAAPAIPLIFGSKVLKGSLSRAEFRSPALRALPYLALFVGAWSAGELAGTVIGPSRGRR